PETGYEYITINDKKIFMVPSVPTAAEIKNLPWESLGIDIVIDTTDAFKKYVDLEKHLEAGAKVAITSKPFDEKNPAIQRFSFVPGVNTHLYDAMMRLISGASCTTNCLMPVLSTLHKKRRVLGSVFATIHSATASNQIIDKRAKKPERGRSLPKNTILTSTGADLAAGYVMPELQGLLAGDSVRINLTTGSVIADFIVLDEEVSADDINNDLLEASRNELADILSVEDEINASTQIIGRNETSIVAAKSTMAIPLGNNKTLAVIVHWYDNEWGYDNQLIRLVKIVGEVQQNASSALATAIKSDSQNETSASSVITAKDTWNTGGIAFDGINIDAKPGSVSSPLFNIPFDPATFQGFGFQIISIEDIDDLDSVFIQPKEEKELTSLIGK
ncbi:MAG: hypothetical protein ABH858_02715, partial [Candidatus Omnitrophota bacterium]